MFRFPADGRRFFRRFSLKNWLIFLHFFEKKLKLHKNQGFKNHHPMTENDISYLIRGAIFRIYNALGPGLYESAYEALLAYELKKLNLKVETQVPLPLVHEGVSMEIGYRVDLWVENKVIIEIKSVEHLQEVHHKQLLTYLKLSGMKLGLLVNFNSADINKSIFRKVNHL